MCVPVHPNERRAHVNFQSYERQPCTEEDRRCRYTQCLHRGRMQTSGLWEPGDEKRPFNLR